MELGKTAAVIFCLGFALSSLWAFADCQRGRTIYEEALNQEELSVRIRLLKEAIFECRSYSAFLELGKCYEVKGDFAEAEQAYRDAFAQAKNEEQEAGVLVRCGLLYEKMGKENEAVLCLRKSYRIHPYPKVLERLKEIEGRRAGTVMNSETIKKALAGPSVRSLARGFSVQPSLDLYIHFEFDSWKMDATGKEQADQLGGALKDEMFSSHSFILIGHTDSRGSESYNLRLSERRAESVKEYLVRRFSLDPGRIRTEGRGEREPLFPGNSELEHALNRRVEVRLE